MFRLPEEAAPMSMPAACLLSEAELCVCDMNKTPGTQGDSRPASRKKTVVWQGCRDSGGMPGEGMQKVRRGDSPKFRKK